MGCELTPGVEASTQNTAGPSVTTSHPSAPSPGVTQDLRPLSIQLSPTFDACVAMSPSVSSPAFSCQATPAMQIPESMSAFNESRNAEAGSADSNATACTPAPIKGSGSGRRPISSTTASRWRKSRPRPPSASGTRIAGQPASTILHHSARSKPGTDSRNLRIRDGEAMPCNKERALSRKAVTVSVVSIDMDLSPCQTINAPCLCD